MAGLTYAAQTGAHVIFICIFRSHLPHAARKKEAGRFWPASARPGMAIRQFPCRHRQMIHCPVFFQIPGSKHRICPNTHQCE